jgi:hypothetical protein
LDSLHEELLNKLKRGEAEIEINPNLNLVPFMDHVKIKRFIRTLQNSTIYTRDNGETWMKICSNLAVEVSVDNNVIHCLGYSRNYNKEELVTPLEYNN